MRANKVVAEDAVESARADGSPTGAPPGTAAVTVTLQAVSFLVRSRAKGPDGRRPDLPLVDRDSACFLPGRLSALMGPSGSGKTTLLDLLAGRKTSGRREGAVRFSGIQPSREYQRRFGGYVEQFDTLLPILTVREMLLYTAELKRPLSEPLAAKRQAVEALLSRLALDSCAEVRIGSPMSRGISGGQAKRTNIAIALITNPRVLFLDEPTTGLDSYTANEVMLAVQSVARGGVTVVSTIHSPTAFTYSLFDTLHMLVGGRSVYLGPPDASAVAYFTDSQPSRQLHPDGIAGLHVGSNSAELLTALVAEADRGGMARPLPGRRLRLLPLAAANAAELAAQLQAFGAAQLPKDLAAELAVTRATVTPWWWGIWVYGKYRSARNYTSPTFLLQRVMDKLFISLLIMTLYLGVGDDLSDGNVMNVAAILFAWSAATVFAAAGYVPSLVLERGLFVRERADGLYHATTYLTAKLLDELVINTVVALGVAAFTLYGIQFANSFAVFYVSYIIGIFIGITAAYFVASIAPNMDVANALLPIYGTTVMFFAGFLIRLDAMPAWWKWYAYIDYAKYTWGAVMINQFKDRPQPWIGGQTVLEYFALDGVSEWAYLGYACLFFLFFYVSTALVLTFKQYQVR